MLLSYFLHILVGSGLQLSLLDQMKLVYESNAYSIEHLIISSCESSKAFVSGGPPSTSSSCNSDGDDFHANVSKINNVIFARLVIVFLFYNSITQRQTFQTFVTHI